jgi:hypothetical protein
MKEALVAILLADSAIAALVSDRVYWNLRTQGKALPAITLHVVSDNLVHFYQGAGGHFVSRVQIDAFGRTNAAMDQLSQAVITALAGRRYIQNSVEFQGIFYRNGRDLTEEGRTEADRIYRFSLDFEIHHRRV